LILGITLQYIQLYKRTPCAVQGDSIKLKEEPNSKQ